MYILDTGSGLTASYLSIARLLQFTLVVGDGEIIDNDETFVVIFRSVGMVMKFFKTDGVDMADWLEIRDLGWEGDNKELMKKREYKREGIFYRKLQALQGNGIPLMLGKITYNSWPGLLLSYEGRQVDRDDVLEDEKLRCVPCHLHPGPSQS